MAIRRLLVDLPNWVGDTAMALPAVARLFEYQAERRVLAVRRPVRRWLELLFPEADVVVLGRREKPWAAAKIMRQALGGRAELAVTLRNSTRSRLTLALAARRRLGPRPESHQVTDLDPALRSLGLEPADPSWRPSIPELLVDEGREALAGLDPDRLVGLAPAAAWGPSKCWPIQHWGDLARRLIAAERQPLLLIGPGEEPLVEAIQEAAGESLPSRGPELDIAGLFGLMSHLSVVVANDSGPMHLAAAAGCRVIALFGPTDQERTAPLGSGHVILDRGLDCAPCFRPNCPLVHQDCLAGIDAGAVLAAIAGDEGTTGASR